MLNPLTPVCNKFKIQKHSALQYDWAVESRHNLVVILISNSNLLKSLLISWCHVITIFKNWPKISCITLFLHVLGCCFWQNHPPVKGMKTGLLVSNSETPQLDQGSVLGKFLPCEPHGWCVVRHHEGIRASWRWPFFTYPGRISYGMNYMAVSSNGGTPKSSMDW